MPRQIKNNHHADAILCADTHLRDDVPECRTDDYRAAVARKVKFLGDLQREHGCPIIDGADLFHKWQVSSELEGWALLNLPASIVTTCGNHDLPNHSLALYKKSSLHVLEAAGKVKVLTQPEYSFWNDHSCSWITGFPYGHPLGMEPEHKQDRNVAIVHAYVAETLPPFIKDGWTPDQLLRALPGYDLIVSGHNHEPFVYVHEDRQGARRLVVNAGSMMRMFADQDKMQPRCWLWYADTNKVEPVYYPIEADVVSREHIEKVEERDARLDAFVNRLDGSSIEISLDFLKNIEDYLVKNKIRPSVSSIIRQSIEGL